MAIYATNKATKSRNGNGLPFYENIDYVFSKRNKGFDDAQGIWKTQQGLLPTFQINEFELDNLASLTYVETRGKNEFTGLNIAVPLGTFMRKQSNTLNGQAGWWFHYVVNPATPAPFEPLGRYIMIMTLSGTAGVKVLYSEEFLVTNCCGF